MKPTESRFEAAAEVLGCTVKELKEAFAKTAAAMQAQRAEVATPSAEYGMVLVPVELLETSKAIAEAVRWVLHDAAYKAPEQIGVVAQRWIDRLRGAENTAAAKLLNTPGVGSDSGPLRRI